MIQTSSGEHKIPAVATSWVDEGGTITESDDSFGQVTPEFIQVMQMAASEYGRRYIACKGQGELDSYSR